MTVLTFGAITEIIGKSNFAIDDVADTVSLKQKLESAFPVLRDFPYAMAVNKKIVTGSTPLDTMATVALLPPFSGG